MTAPGLSTTEYTYDAANRLTGISRGSESVSMEYDAANRLQGITLPDGIEEAYGRDASGDATSIEYREGKEELGDIHYAYDEDGLLEAEWGSYARVGLPEALGSTAYNAANELTEREGQKLSYDADGNLVAEGSNEYVWNPRGELSHIGGEGSASFSYDPFGMRVSRNVGGQTTESLYDGANVVRERTGSTSASLLTGIASDQLFSRLSGGATDSYLTDRLGSVIGLADESGAVQTEYTYEPFGSVVESGAPSDNPFQYTGRELDGTGLEYDRPRYYSPAQGRFVSQDPIGFAGSGTNLYLYAGGDPLDATDWSGLCEFVCISIVCGGQRRCVRLRRGRSICGCDRRNRRKLLERLELHRRRGNQRRNDDCRRRTRFSQSRGRDRWGAARAAEAGLGPVGTAAVNLPPSAAAAGTSAVVDPRAHDEIGSC